MSIDQVFGLVNVNVNENLYAVDNVFVRQLNGLSIAMGKELKLVSFVQKDGISNRGEVANRNISASDKSVLDICKLTPLTQTYQLARTLMDEVAEYRTSMLGFTDVPQNFSKKYADVLMADYLLSSCLCYVEIFDGNEVKDKFFATRNRFVAAKVAGIDPAETSAYGQYLQAYSANYTSRQLKVLKLTQNKKGFRITQPRSFVDFSKGIKVTPFFLISNFVDALIATLKQGMVKVTYIKDNMTEREMVSTLNPNIISHYYDEKYATMAIENSGSVLKRGYIQIPELGLSRYDAKGTRSLNILRITSVVPVNDFNANYIDVVFDNIEPNFLGTIEDLPSLPMLKMIYEDLHRQPAPFNDANQLRNAITSFYQTQVAIGSTQSLRAFHDYMAGRPQIFKAYNGGKPVSYSGSGSIGMNLGGV